MKWLLIDFDQSTASIGGYEGAQRLLGLAPIPCSGGVTGLLVDGQYKPRGLRQILGDIITIRQVREQHPLFQHETSVRTVIMPNERAEKLGLSGIIIDTATTMAQQQIEIITSKKSGGKLGIEPRMELQDWGVFQSIMMRLWQSISETQLPFVVTAHVKRKRDDAGAIVEETGISGSSGTDMLRFFDVVLHTRIQKTKTKTQFLWQTHPDERRAAKDRLDVLSDTMPQDLSVVLYKYMEAGIPHPKILIIGESGHGKTRCVETIQTGEMATEYREMLMEPVAA